MPIKQVDKAEDGRVVQKVTKTDGTFLRYQAGVPGKEMEFFETLVTARSYIGKGSLPKKARGRMPALTQ